MTTSSPHLFLHIGLLKTASTAMQDWFTAQRAPMRKRGVWYPKTGKAKAQNHGFLVDEIETGGPFPILSRLLANAKAPNILLSREGLTQYPGRLPDTQFQKFRDATRGVEKTLILVTRDPKAWMRSYYGQCVLEKPDPDRPWRSTSMSFQEFCDQPRIQFLAEGNGFAQQAQKDFGATGVIHLRLEDPDWFKTLLDHLGLGDLADLELPRRNQSTPDWMVQFIRYVNMPQPPLQTLETWKAALQNFQPTGHDRLIRAAARSKRYSLADLDQGIFDQIRAAEGPDMTDEFDRALTAFQAFLRDGLPQKDT